MAIKMMVLVRRRADLTHAQFRDGYENSHARLAVRLFGHLWTAYRRNYLISGRTFAHGNVPGSLGPDEIGFDAISEFELPDVAALEEMGRIAGINFDMIKADEAQWFDDTRCWVVTAETVVEDLSNFRSSC